MDRNQTRSVVIPLRILAANNALGVVFVILKAADHISWSWWVTLLPFYAGNIGLVLLGLFIFWVLLGRAFSFGRIR